MNLLIITGASSQDIFIASFAKWLKTTIDVNIDVYGLSNNDIQKNDNSFYRYVGSPIVHSFLEKKYIRSILKPFIVRIQLNRWLKNREYDIIHCHWLVPSIIINKNLRNHCKKLFVTFWGGELESLQLYGSHSNYLKKLSCFLKQVDGVINSKEFHSSFNVVFPGFNGQYSYAQFGSEPIEKLCELMKHESKEDSKQALNIPKDRISVQIGYSGKQLHQHIDVIKELSFVDGIKKNIFLLAPMTRNYNIEYVAKIEEALKKSEIPYLILKGYLSDIEIARLRNATDVIFQFSTFDGFSRSIVEGLCAKSVLFYGNWLKYDQYLKKWDLFAIKSEGITDGVKRLQQYITHFAEYNTFLEHNNENLQDSFMWRNCIKDWINAYNS